MPLEISSPRGHRSRFILTMRPLLFGLGVLALSHAPACAEASFPTPEHPLIGTLQSDPRRIEATTAAGIQGVTVGVSWDQAEPEEGRFDAAYFRQVSERIAAFRRGGKQVVLDLGVQYPPRWLVADPSSRFVDQYGRTFDPAPGAGECGINLVFRQAMRERYAAYLEHLFSALGNDFAAVRLGGGRYGELGYPDATYRGRKNCYWAFDEAAQGRASDRPEGIAACPVPGWVPGTPSPKHEAAHLFLEWYLDSLRNYHDWQIATARRFFDGPLYMLYPSIGGIRPGQLAAAIDGDAAGLTGPERTGELGRGYDTARFVAGITDPKVVVYTTWLDGCDGCDDAGSDPVRWSPGRFLARLAADHLPPLATGGENTGQPDDPANLALTLRRMRENRLSVFFWAFEPTLFDGRNGHATISDFARELGR